MKTINTGTAQLTDLINRLQKHSEWKYPNRPWTKAFWDGCAFVWKNKQDELEQRVLGFEETMKTHKTG